jgi:hypothetical protein
MRGDPAAVPAPEGRPRSARVAGAAAFALLLACLTVLLEPAGRRGAAAGLVVAGLAVGVPGGLRLRARGRRTPMERLNDAAFLVVLAAASLVATGLARPWTAAVPGLVGGVLVGRATRPPAGGRAGQGQDAGEADGV